jgi:Zn-finger nucleic acid-binding protein
MHCRKPNAATARTCVHCGRETSRALLRSERSPIHCPSCSGEAHFVQLASITIDLCGRCAGLWLDKDEVAQLPDALSDGEMREAAKATLQALRGSTATVRPSPYLPCPVCARVMTRHNYLQVSGIMLDRCAEHGTWLDHAHAQRLLELLDGSRIEELREAASRAEKDALERRLRNLESEQRGQAAGLERVARRQAWHLVFDVLDIL